MQSAVVDGKPLKLCDLLPSRTRQKVHRAPIWAWPLVVHPPLLHLLLAWERPGESLDLRTDTATTQRSKR